MQVRYFGAARDTRTARAHAQPDCLGRMGRTICFLVAFLFPYRLGIVHLRMRGAQPAGFAIPEYGLFVLQPMQQVAVVLSPPFPRVAFWRHA